MNLRILTKRLTLTDEAKDRIERRVYFALGRFSDRIRSVHLTLEDENGRRGGIDKCCQILVKSRGAKDVIVEGRGDDIRSLVDRTADRAGRAVARNFDLRPWEKAVGVSGRGPRRSGNMRGLPVDLLD
jgi:ribosome-associated translation inhibitor RaiA